MSSGGITMLIARGSQDEYLSGNPDVSFFKSVARKHTNFAQTTDRQTIQGNVQNGGLSTVRFERKGDLLSYVYLTPIDGSATWTRKTGITDWSTLISKCEILVGGQVVDEMDSHFIQHIAPKIFANNYSKSKASGISGQNTFLPLRFWFCENWSSALPLVALSHHDVELRITWGPQAANNDLKWEVYASYLYLDTDERSAFTAKPIEYVITQTQKSIASQSKMHELTFNHPVKLLAAANTSGASLLGTTNRLKLQMNGTDVSEAKLALPNFSLVPLYYHMPFANVDGDENQLLLIPFCLESSKSQPTGSVNWSRLDSARIVSETDLSNDDIYAVSYNIFKVSQGMGALAFAS